MNQTPDSPVPAADQRDLGPAEAAVQTMLTVRLGPSATFVTSLEDGLFAPRPARGRTRVSRRRALISLAAGVTATVAVGGAISLLGEPSVSAEELMERATAVANNPQLASAQSFHILASMHHPGDGGRVRDALVEQWFSAPRRFRTETRTVDSTGRVVTSGELWDGGAVTRYRTVGATESTFFLISTAPIASLRTGQISAPRGRGDGPDADATMSPSRAVPPGIASPGPIGVTSRNEETRSTVGTPESRYEAVWVRKVEREGEGALHVASDQADVTIRLDACKTTRRPNKELVAGRATYVVERDLSGCVPPDLKLPLGVRSQTWIDVETSMPLKILHYGRDGAVSEAYEVTLFELQIAIPDTLFESVPPAGTEVVTSEKLGSRPRP
ncbi:MAG: hypothetical protein U0821_19760 [Chloroflexota bacterium]